MEQVSGASLCDKSAVLVGKVSLQIKSEVLRLKSNPEEWSKSAE